MKWLLVLLMACDAPSPATYGAHTTMLTFARGGCYGSCPIYSVRVFRDGQVSVVGTMFVKTQGEVTGTLTDAQLDQLDHLFATHPIPSKDFVRYDVTDDASAQFAYASPQGALTSVQHYFGDQSSPAGLKAIEDGIDRIIGIEKYIGTEAERQAAEKERTSTR
ncbi:MAG: DUF6438 domain-containing protein [Kofleriaceae bacterium]